MRMSFLTTSAFGLALLAGGAVPASAQPYDQAYGPAPPESVEVIAPRITVDSHRLNGPLERVSMSSEVRYDDLDVGTRQGARELRHRVISEAHNVCERLAEAYPFHTLQGDHCFRQAADNALVQADGAITKARMDYWYGR
ncbi:MAG TPA: UrcA family protein [Rhizomicrobium sp.]|jgi:UrcA family protein